MTPQIAPLALVAVFLAICVASDLRSRRIPNALTLPVVGVGLLLAGAGSGLPGVTSALSGTLLAIGILVVPFALGGIGGGDVKMMAAVGALVGPRALLASLTAGVILGGLVAVGVVWRRGCLGEKLRVVGVMTRSAFLTRSLAPLRAPAPTPDTVALPYSVPLGVGTAFALSLRYALGA